MDLQAKTDDDIAAMLRSRMNHIETLTRSASEKFKQSETSEWDEGLYQEGTELLVEAERLQEQIAQIGEELERRLDHVVQEDHKLTPTLQPSDHDQRWYRKDLTTRTVPVTGTIDNILPKALEDLLSFVPSSWWLRQQDLAKEEQRNAVFQPLLLCGSERWGRDFSTLHRYAYYLSVAESHLKGDPELDIYGGQSSTSTLLSWIFYRSSQGS